jgi:hypothetical protein
MQKAATGSALPAPSLRDILDLALSVPEGIEDLLDSRDQGIWGILRDQSEKKRVRLIGEVVSCPAQAPESRPVQGPHLGQALHLHAHGPLGGKERAQLVPDLWLHPGCHVSSQVSGAVRGASCCGGLLDRSLLRMSLANKSAGCP